MILVWLIALPLVAGLLSWGVARVNLKGARWISLGAMLAGIGLTLKIWIAHPGGVEWVRQGAWMYEIAFPWIRPLGIEFHLGMDGLSLVLVALTFFIGAVSVATSWTEITERVGFFHFNLMWIIAGITGVFLCLDLFLLYVFWEVMLIPMYLLIGIWGHEKRNYASMKFFLFTQASGVLMLIAIVALSYFHFQQTGEQTFDYLRLLGTSLPPAVAFWIMLGFFIAFAVKLPMVPFHTWLPDAHTEAPTAGSVILAGLLLKTGGYGLIRFVIPLFPETSAMFAPTAMALGAIGIIYGAILAFGQHDFKRLVAYTSVSHLGFVILGIYAWNELALQGVVMQMICHGLSTSALFILGGLLYERIHTRDMRKMGGLWSAAPKMGAIALFFAMASLGLPGLGNFIAEILVLVGAFQVNVKITVIATLGLVAATIYSLALLQRAFMGSNKQAWTIPDLSVREVVILGSLMIGLIWLGLYPQPVLDVVEPALAALQNMVNEPVLFSGVKQ